MNPGRSEHTSPQVNVELFSEGDLLLQVLYDIFQLYSLSVVIIITEPGLRVFQKNFVSTLIGFIFNCHEQFLVE